MKPLHIADLFCGAGGTSTGAIQAAERLGYSLRLTAVNHWERAVETHSANHPSARHLKQQPHKSGIGLVGWDSATEWFSDIWDSIYGNWDANPWVWVYTFRRVK
jgi:site-specific DNA-cytosine methylase